MIVYNVPKHRAIDLVEGDKYSFIGDSMLQQEGALQNFHLKPARIAMHASKRSGKINGFNFLGSTFIFFGKRIMILDKPVSFMPAEKRLPVDVLIISGNPAIKIADISVAIIPSIIVFDASNSLWKIAGWRKECERLFLRCHSVPGQGAFIFDVDQQVIGH